MKHKKSALFSSLISLLLCLSMLVGTTFAWFTDYVVTGINTIAAGVLDVELYHSNATVTDEQVTSATKLFMDLQGKPILWEPGVVSFENLRIANAGDLALMYQLAINTANENFVVDPSGAKYGLSQILKVGVVEGGITATDRAGVVASVKDYDWTTLGDFLRDGRLLPEGAGESEEVWGIVVYWEPGENDNFWNLNNGKQLNEGEVLNIDLGVKLVATQAVNELDNFGNDYDGNAKAEFFPGFQGGSAGAVVTPNDQGVTTADVAMDGGDVSAVIPTGVQVADGTNSLTLSVTVKEKSEANIQLNENEEMRPLDVHIEGVAQGNTVPMLITLKHYLSTGINTGALKLYHVENDVPVAMTQVENPVNHNEFSYDPLTGDVTLALASFSEIATVADTNNTWNGTAATAFAGGTGTEADPYLITNADQLAYFRNQVDGGNTFEGKFVKLENNITLSNVNFDPIGWGYDYDGYTPDGKTFNGTFDGDNHFIFDLKQDGWDLGYSYSMAGGGLFASVVDATIKNLKISGANIRMECIDMGVLVGYSQGNCTYKNIDIYNSKIANYQRSTGGVVGEVTCKRDTSGKPVGESVHTFDGVRVHNDVVVGTLWGDFDAACGGVIGGRWDDDNTTKVVMKNVEVRCRMDVYSDVTAAYQWHAYRRAGMLIGNTDIPAADGRTAKQAEAPFLKCENVKVYYGDWANYHYCLFTNDNNPGKGYPWVRVEAGENNAAYSNPRYGHPIDMNGNPVTDSNHTHKDGDTCSMEIRFNQLYGGGQGVYGQPIHENVTVESYRYSVTYVNDAKVLAIDYVTEAGAYTPANKAAQDLVLEWAEENINGGTIAFGGWMNAASIKLTEIHANNTKNIVLYPYFNSPYTASFVDQQGHVLAWCLFNDSDVSRLSDAFATAKANLPALEEGFELHSWQIRGTNLVDGKVTATLAKDNTDWESFKGYKDVTITPKYRYNGVELIEVVDELTGEIDHYEAAGYGSGLASTVVKIPGSVNGKDVTQINANAFSSYDKLHVVVIPATVEAIGNKAISDQNAGYSKQETVSIYYEGSYADWQAKKYGQDWITGLGEGTRIFFLNGGDTVDSGTYLQVKHKKIMGYITGYSLEEKTNAADLVGEYYAQCNCDVDGCKGNLRPDAHYWEAYAN